MPNIPDITNDLEFEQQLATMSDHDILFYLARMQRQTNARCGVCFEQIEGQERRVAALEQGNIKHHTGMGALSGGVVGAITAIVIGVVEHFSKR